MVDALAALMVICLVTDPAAQLLHEAVKVALRSVWSVVSITDILTVLLVVLLVVMDDWLNLTPADAEKLIVAPSNKAALLSNA
jgi:phage-related holin